jgi:hypothetical protein
MKSNAHLYLPWSAVTELVYLPRMQLNQPRCRWHRSNSSTVDACCIGWRQNGRGIIECRHHANEPAWRAELSSI